MLLGFPEEKMPTYNIVASQTPKLPEVFIIDSDGNITIKAVTDMNLVEPAPIRFEIQQLEVFDFVDNANP